MSQMTWHTCSDILHRELVCGVKKEGREACWGEGLVSSVQESVEVNGGA